MFGQAFRCQAGEQRPSNPNVYFGARAFGDHRVGRLLNAVVQERIRSLQTKNQAAADGIPHPSVDLPVGLPKSESEQRDVGYVPETSELLQSALRGVRQSLEIP